MPSLTARLARNETVQVAVQIDHQQLKQTFLLVSNISSYFQVLQVKREMIGVIMIKVMMFFVILL